MTHPLFIGIDLGGTNIKCILVDSKGRILKTKHTKTNDLSDGEKNRAYWKKHLSEIIKDFAGSQNQSALPIGIATPGLTDFEHKSISYMPGRLSGIENLDWQKLLGLEQVWLINDANAALMAEHYWGAGRGKDDLVLITLGTGVGGAIMVNGKLVKGWLHRAGHLGHITLDLKGDHGIVGLPGTLESLVGDATVSKRTNGIFSSTLDIIRAHRANDPKATAIWMDTVRHLAIGICNIINILSPQLIILSGGITKADQDLFNPLHSFMDKYEWKPGGLRTPIVRAQYVPFAGAAGAAGFAMQQLNILS